MAHYMTYFSIDHAFDFCPAWKAGLKHHPTKVFEDPDLEWEADFEHDPEKGRPFGLCGWCWRVYQARAASTSPAKESA